MPSIFRVCRIGRCDPSTVRMISSFSEAGYLIPRPSHPRSCFFEQTVLKGQVSHNLLQSGRFRAQFLNLRRCRLTLRIPSQALFARFEEFLRPRVIEALADPLPAAKCGNALLAAKSRQYNPELLFGRVVFPGLAAKAFNQLIGRVLRCSRFLVHLRYMMAAMNQKSSVTKTSNLSQRC